MRLLRNNRKHHRMPSLQIPDEPSFQTQVVAGTILSHSFFSYFICHLQGFQTYQVINQLLEGLQIPLADNLQRLYLQAVRHTGAVAKVRKTLQSSFREENS